MPEANNLAFQEIKTDYVIRLDIDHYFDEKNINSLLNSKLDLDKHYYIFNRFSISQRKIRPHRNSYIISKKNYWKVKGYNESFSGNYGLDDIDFMRRLERKINKRLLKNICLLVNCDFRTKCLNRDVSINRNKLKNKCPHLIFRNKKYYKNLNTIL